jgi:hypothetical protein
MIDWKAVRDKEGVKKWKVESGNWKAEKWGREGQMSDFGGQESVVRILKS